MAFWFTIFLFAAFTVLGDVLRPKPKDNTPKPSALGDFTVPTADSSRPIPAIFGTVLVGGPNCVWYGDLQVTPITQKVRTGLFSSETITTAYRYSLGMDLVLCHGTVDSFRTLRFEDKAPAVTTSTVGDHLRISLDYPGGGIGALLWPNRNLFGGDIGGGGVGGQIDLYYGLAAQTRNDYLAAKTAYANISGYPYVCHAVFRGTYLGTSPYIKNPSFELGRFPNTLGLTGGQHIIGGLDCNPAAALYEILTDPVWGLGRPTGEIDIASFQAAGATLATEGFGLSFQIDSVRSAKSACDEILRHIDGVIFPDPATGKQVLKLARKDYTVGALLVVDQTSAEDAEISRPSWSELSNDIHVKFTSRSDNYTPRIAQQQNLAAIQIRGERATDVIDFLMATSGAVANAIAARSVKTLSYPLARVQVTVSRKAWQLHACDVFVLNWPAESIVGMVLRVITPDYGALEEGKIVLQCVEDIFSVVSTAFTPPGASGWVDPVQPVAVPTAQRLVEAPYHLIGSSARHVLAIAVRSAGADLGYEIESDRTGGTAYTITNSDGNFCASGLLQSSYAASTAAVDATGFIITSPVDPARLETIGADDFAGGVNLCLIDSEIMAFETVADNGNGTFTISNVMRGVLDTVPAAHSSSARVYFIMPSGVSVLDPLNPYPNPGNVRAKLLPYNVRSVLDSAAATALLITTASRAQAPYPPGNVKIAGVAWPTTVTVGVNIAVTWAVRHRTAQYDALAVVAQDTGDFVATPEGTYTIEVRINGSLIATRTVPGIATTTWTWTAAFQTADGATPGSTVSIRVIPVNGSLSGTYQERIFTAA